MSDLAYYEKLGSRRKSEDIEGENSNGEIIYIITGTNDDAIVMNTALVRMPYTFRGLRRDNIDINPVGPDQWEATASYSDPEKEEDDEEDGDSLETGEGVWSFDTTGETHNLKYTRDDPLDTNPRVQNRQRRGFASGGSRGGLMYGAINVDGDSVNGVDIVVPSLKMTYRTKLSKGFVSVSWVRKVAAITGTTNAQPFYGFDPGELLFMGISGEESTQSDPQVTFSFQASSNFSEPQIYDVVETDGETTVEMTKKGWEYLWFYYETVEDPTTKRTKPKPVDVYINQIYDESDFTVLGIGGVGLDEGDVQPEE